MQLRPVFWFLLGLALALLGSRAFAFEGSVIRIVDGDTLVVRNERGEVEKIRLVKVDAPEISQPYGGAAKTALATQCPNGSLAIVTRKGRSFDRTVAAVICAGQDAGRYLVGNGWAWRYRYSSDKGLDRLQAQARQEGIGLWADPTPIEPYLWRKQHKERT